MMVKSIEFLLKVPKGISPAVSIKKL